MIRPKSLRQLAYSISLPAFAISPKMAKDTVYMPSHVAAEMLGNATKPTGKTVDRRTGGLEDRRTGGPEDREP